MPRRYSPRLEFFDYCGVYRYSLTCCTFQRLPIFTSSTTVCTVLEKLRLAAHQHAFSVLAYCFMPDHLHMLVAGDRADSDLRRFVERAKQRSGYWYRHHSGGHLWQRSYWDRVLRKDEETLAVVRYILANPVRAGLVERPLDYPFSGSCVYERQMLVASFEVTDPAG